MALIFPGQETKYLGFFRGREVSDYPRLGGHQARGTTHIYMLTDKIHIRTHVLR